MEGARTCAGDRGGAAVPEVRRDAAMLAVLALVSLVFFGPYVAGRFPVSTDISLFHTPNYSLRYDDGLPLWNAHQGCGMPMDRDMQFAALYPLRVPFYFMPWQVWLGPFLLFHHLLALTGMALLLRAFGLSRTASCGGAIAFACGGFYTAYIITTTVMQALSWLPWLLLGAVERRARGGVFAAAGIAMILLIGSPHLILYGGLAFGFLMLLCAPALPGGMTPRQWLLRWAQFAAGIGVGMINLLPGLLQVSESMRTATDVAGNLANSLHPRELIRAVLGGAGGVIYPEINDKCLYVGGAGLLALASAVCTPRAWRHPAVRAGAGLALLGFVLALGENAGWQNVLPLLPGFRQLAGPARALLLTATGISVLIAFGIDGIRESSLRRSVVPGAGMLIIAAAVTLTYRGEVPWQWTGVALQAWLGEPGWLVGGAWTGLNTALVIVPAVALPALRASAGTRRLFAPAFVALLLVQLLMFAPRVAPHTVPPDTFDPPPNVRHLMELTRDQPPFRVAGIDPLQYSDTAWDSVHKVRFLLPNLSALYGIGNIALYNPLLEREYVRMFRETAGQPVFNDPFRKLDPARPDTRLYQSLNVRYQIGHPMDRRLTNQPQTVSPGRPVSEVTAWTDIGETRPVAEWHFVSFTEGGRTTERGTEVAVLELDTPKGAIALPVRFGHETGALFDAAGRTDPLAPPIVNMTWTGFFGAVSDPLETRLTNYRGSLKLDPPVRVLRARWRLTDPSVGFVIPAQAWRVHDPAEAARWRLVFDDPVAPVFELLDARPRESWLPGEAAADTPGIAAESGEDQGLEPVGRTARGRVWSLNTETAGRLLVRETWSAGWRAEVDGKPVRTERVEGVLIGVPVPAGRHSVRLTYSPPLLVPLSLLALLSAGLIPALVLAEQRLSGQGSADR